MNYIYNWEVYNTRKTGLHRQYDEEKYFMNADGRIKTRENPIELVFHNIHDHGVEIMDLWMSEVQKRTGGRVRFTKTAGEDPVLIKAADVIRDVPAASDRYHLLNLIQLPFIFPGSTVGSPVVAQLYEEFPELREELSDVKIVGLGIGALMALFSSKAWGPIRTLEDFKGARTRSLPLIDGIITTLGAKPRHVGFLEIGPLLAKGDLDATVLGMLPAKMFKLAEGPAPYCTITGNRSITMHPMRTYMKWDSWNALPPDIRVIIDGIGPARGDCWFAVQSGKDADSHLVEATEYIKRYGELINITAEELERWRRLIQPNLDAVLDAVEARGLPGHKFFNRMLDLVDEYSREVVK
jgi:TRAP-type C4-dicarboxylate transport system substrate-binding protein